VAADQPRDHALDVGAVAEEAQRIGEAQQEGLALFVLAQARLDAAAFGGVARHADDQFDRPVLGRHRPPA
jgi:hypothetical protein